MNAALAETEDDALPFDATAWSALRFVPSTRPATPRRGERLVVAAIVLGLHALFWWVIDTQSRNESRMAPAPEQAIVVDFIQTLPRQVVRAPKQEPTPTSRLARPDATPRPTVPRRTRVRAAATTNAPFQLYMPDGSLRLPDGLLEDLERAEGERQFDFQLPNLEESGRFVQRPPVLAYEATRFDQYWEPANETLLNEILRKAAEKTTKEVRIPIPGAPGRSLVCRVSLLAAGGACGMERNGGNGVVSLDDPTTLDAAEAAACQAWWNKIVGATTQSEWRATRKLYEAECRKPLAKVSAEPEPLPVEGAVVK